MNRNVSFVSVACLGALSALAFLLAMATYPGGGYNPALQMLSALGRTEVRLVEYPWCHYFFIAGMLFSSWAIASAVRRMGLSWWGAAVNIAGLASIAAVPENVNMDLHNVGCWLAAGGGAVMLFFWRRTEGRAFVRWAWTVALLAPILFMGLALQLHSFDVLPFSPYVTFLQKAVILSYASWLLFVSARGAGRREIRIGFLFLLVPFAFAAWMALRPGGLTAKEILKSAPPAVERPKALPVSGDELAAIAWLERVTGPLSKEEEQEWWDIGGSQHGIFAKRYSVAFAGYAAAAIGMRGDADLRKRVGKVLGNCVRRMIRRDAWAYSMSKNYWGRKPWAPDPCRRENVMYTGHLMHLLALYELFTGDARYHRKGDGWDFTWNDGSKVHYDVERLVDVTVEQMRRGPNGGVTCEPGLMFFPCNSHPHVALAIFKRLGYGDWTKDAERWEKWALAHYFSPAFGGGAVNLVYYAPANMMYPRGQGALDGWSFLWYDAWASDRRIASALWQRARDRIDWQWIETADDSRCGADCCDPQPVPPSVACVFLAAAARACGDQEAAERLEKAVDARFLKRGDGFYRLDLDREWRIGASAMRIISLAESNGSSFRQMR